MNVWNVFKCCCMKSRKNLCIQFIKLILAAAHEIIVSSSTMFDWMCLYENAQNFTFYNIGCKAFAIFSSTTEGLSADFLISMCLPGKLEIPCAENSNLVIFPEVGAIDHLKWTYDEAFEQLFGPGRGGFQQRRWRMVKSETRQDAKIQVKNARPRFRDSKKVKTNHAKKTRLRDLSNTLSRFRVPAKIFPVPCFSRYHSPPPTKFSQKCKCPGSCPGLVHYKLAIFELPNNVNYPNDTFTFSASILSKSFKTFKTRV